MARQTNNGKKGGLLKGKSHKRGGIQAVVTDTQQPVELEGGEVIINKHASKKHWKELSEINQSAGDGVPILPPNEFADGDSFAKGGVITYKNKYNKRYGYPLDESHTLSQIAKDTGRSIKGLQQIYNKGIGAYKTNPESVRPNVKSKEQWAMARVYSAVMGGKASRVDKNELAMAKGGITLPLEGTLIAKDKKSKLDYKKIGNNYEFSVYDGEPVENHLRVQFKKRNGNKVTMTYDQFINYIYAEGFIDDKAKGGELAMSKGGGIPERYKNMGFDRVGQKKTSTNPQKKWMVLAKKGDQYKVVHGGYKGMEDFSQHHDTKRRERFWNRMGGKDSAKANDPFSPLYWHKKFGTWEQGGNLAIGIEAESEHMATANKLYNREITPSQAPESIAREHLKEDKHYYSRMAVENYLRNRGYRFAKGGGVGSKSVWEKNGFVQYPKSSPQEWKLVEWSLNGHSPNFKGKMYFQKGTGLMFIEKENGELYKPQSSNKLFWRELGKYAKGGKTATAKSTKAPVKKTATTKTKTVKPKTKAIDTSIDGLDITNLYGKTVADTAMVYSIYPSQISSDKVLYDYELLDNDSVDSYPSNYASQSNIKKDLIKPMVDNFRLSMLPYPISEFDKFKEYLFNPQSMVETIEVVDLMSNNRYIRLEWNQHEELFEEVGNSRTFWSLQGITNKIVKVEWVWTLVSYKQDNGDPLIEVIENTFDPQTLLPPQTTADSPTTTTDTSVATDTGTDDNSFITSVKWEVDTNRLYWDITDNSLNRFTITEKGLKCEYTEKTFFDEAQGFLTIDYDKNDKDQIMSKNLKPLNYFRGDFNYLVGAITGKPIFGDNFEKAEAVWQDGTLKGEMFTITSDNDTFVKIKGKGADAQLTRVILFKDLLENSIRITSVTIYDENDNREENGILDYDEVSARPDIDFSRLYVTYYNDIVDGEITSFIYTQFRNKNILVLTELDARGEDTTVNVEFYGNPKYQLAYLKFYQPLPYYQYDFSNFMEMLAVKDKITVVCENEKGQYIVATNKGNRRSWWLLDAKSGSVTERIFTNFNMDIVTQKLIVKQISFGEPTVKTIDIQPYDMNIATPTTPTATPEIEQPQAEDYDKGEALRNYIANTSPTIAKMETNDYMRRIILNFVNAVGMDNSAMAKEAEKLLKKFND